MENDSDEEEFPPPPSPNELVVEQAQSIVLAQQQPLLTASPSHSIGASKAKPPPPKRSDSTKLTSTPKHSANPNRQSVVSNGPPPITAPKPNRNSHIPAPTQPDQAGDFQSELQMAMQRRLAKINQQAA